MPVTAWNRLIRYVSAQDGEVHYGEPIVSDTDDIDDLAQKGELKVKVLEGPSAVLAKPNGKEDQVKTLLGPLTPAEVPIVRCIGINYKTHSTSPTVMLKSCKPPYRDVLPYFVRNRN